jgi:hypothetical protein
MGDKFFDIWYRYSNIIFICEKATAHTTRIITTHYPTTTTIVFFNKIIKIITTLKPIVTTRHFIITTIYLHNTHFLFIKHHQFYQHHLVSVRSHSVIQTKTQQICPSFDFCDTQRLINNIVFHSSIRNSEYPADEF